MAGPRASPDPGVTGDTEAGANLKRRVVSGVLWNSASTITQQAIQFAVMVALARLLVPADFGLMAEILVFTTFAAVLVDFGFSAALIQREKLEERHLSSAFWLNLGIGLLLTIVVSALGPALALFYHEPKLTLLTVAASVNYVFQSLGIVQGMLLERTLNFRRVALINNTATVVAGLTAVGAAFAGLGVWSIVIQALVSSGARSILLWVSSNWRPRFRLDAGALGDLWGFSVNFAGFNLVNYWSRNADNLLIGRFLDAAALGIYSRAYMLMLMPMSQITRVISVVMYPALARIQHEPDRVRVTYLRVIGIVGLVSFPIATGLFVTARPFVLTVLGHHWLGVVPVLQILCVPLLAQSVGGTVGLIYQTSGRTDWMFRWSLATAPITIAAFAIGIHWGIKGVATGYAIVTVTLFYANFAIPGKLIGVTFRDVVVSIRGPLAAAFAMALSVFAIGRVAAHLDAPLQLGLEILTGGITYILLARTFALRAYVDLLELRANRSRQSGSSPESERPTASPLTGPRLSVQPL